MSSVILPICPFGNIKWWSHYLSAHASLNGYENYQKQTWRNRYDILGANGRQSLTVPISRPSGEKVITSEVKLFHETHWKKVHWRSIKSAYGSSPFWIYYSDQVEELFKKEFTTLAEFSIASIELIIEELQLEKEVHIALQEPEECTDLSTDFKPSKCNFKNKAYLQVFDDRFPFHENLSILDVLFNLGPEAENYLRLQV